MKTYLITIILALLILHELFGKIVNGYERDCGKVRMSIIHLRQLLADNPHFPSRHIRKLNAKIKDLTELLIYHQLTDTLLHKFREIAPDLYASMDTLKDHRGRSVDVYVKFVRIEKSAIKALGAVTLSVTNDEEQLCVSRYGKGTASITITALSNALSVLSHEFGHLGYVVPHLGTYVRYYAGAYTHASSGVWLGHECGDRGGSNALRYEAQFRTRYRRYVRENNGDRVLAYEYINLAKRRIVESFQKEEWRLADVAARPASF